MARIRACVDAVRGGGTGVLELVGDPGIGKSRLLGEAEQVAAQAGLAVVTGSASQFEREVPFAVFARLFEALGGFAGEDVGTQPDVERFRFYREVRDRLSAQPGGRALLLDDLHWADRASLELLQFLLRHPPAVSLLVAVAYRPRQVSARAAEVFTAGGSALLRERLDLAPLGVTDIGTLAGIGGAEARRLHAASGGNPFYALALSGTPYPAEPIHPPATDRIPPAVAAAVRAELSAVPPAELAVLRAAAVAGDPFDPALVAALVERPFAEVLDALDVLAERDLVRVEPSEPGRLRLRHPLLRSIAYHEIRPGQRLTLHARAAAALLDRGAHVVTRAPHLARSAQPGDADAAQALVGAARQILPTAPDTAARWLRKALQLIPHGDPDGDPHGGPRGGPDRGASGEPASCPDGGPDGDPHGGPHGDPHGGSYRGAASGPDGGPDGDPHGAADGGAGGGPDGDPGGGPRGAAEGGAGGGSASGPDGGPDGDPGGGPRGAADGEPGGGPDGEPGGGPDGGSGGGPGGGRDPAATGDRNEPGRWRLMVLLADAEVSSGRVDAGRAVLQQLLDRLPPDATELRLEAVMRSAFADRLLGRYRQATALLSGALSGAGDDDATVLLAVEAVTCSLLRCSADSHGYADRAISAAAAVDKPELAAAASIIVAMNGAFHGDISDALARLDQAAPILDGAYDEALFRLMDPLEQLAWVELLLERTADAIGHFDRGLDISRRHGQVHITPYLLIGRCLALARRGLIDAALESAADAEEASRLIGSDTMQAMALAMRATALLWRDGPDEALRVAEAAVRRNDRTGNDWWAAVARRILARCQLGVGNPAAARHTLLGSAADLDLHDVEACAHPMWFAALAEIEAALGDSAAATRWLVRAEQAAAAAGLRGQQAYVAVAAARLALAAGDDRRALALATDAVAGFDQVGHPLDAAVARLTAAGALARGGQWQQATYQLTEAKAAAERGGASWFLQQVVGMQRQIASGAGRTDAPASPARPIELTAREWEISRLVGEGLSNVQIAFRLHVTPKTVEAHLTRIYRKLGVRSRSGLARAVAGLAP